tara:strand:+ start:94 stop:495 length:402 start_codon:yes stop_codon:yes gene_type:complete
MAVKISRAFKDISLSFTRHPVTNDVIALKNEDAVKRSVINLTRTRFNERYFNELIGTSIDNSLFELMDSGIGDVMETEITTLLNNFEPRINLTSVTVQPNPDDNYLGVKVEYQIVGLPFPQQNIEFLLQPTRV